MAIEPLTGIVIPCFNEAKRLAGERFLSFALQHPTWHLVFIDDGSSDDTSQIIQGLAAQALAHNIHLQRVAHGGKAAAVWAGMQYLRTQNIPWAIWGFYDADQSAPLSELARLIDLFPKQMADAIFASRIQYLGTQITRHWWRHYLGRIFATIVSLAVGLPIYDGQCGLKLFNAPLAATIFKEKFISAWIFDVEIVFRLKALAATIAECPLLRWEDIGKSKLKLRDFIKAPWDLAKIYIHYRN